MPLYPFLEPSDGLTPPGPAVVDISVLLNNPPSTAPAAAPPPVDHFEMMDANGGGMLTEEEMMDFSEVFLGTPGSPGEALEFLGIEVFSPGGSGGTLIENSRDVTNCFIDGGNREADCIFW